MFALRLLFALLLTIQSTAFAQDVVLGGTVVTPNRVMTKGWVVIRRGRIESISEKLPVASGIRVVETGGIIYPGFVDLHNHPMYNVFERWQPVEKFKNRYEWRDLQEYRDLIGTPGGDLQRKNDKTFCDVEEYSEVRALIGGTTSITGISPRRGMTEAVPTCLAGLVRNLDWASGLHGTTVGHERIKNALGITPRDMTLTDEVELHKELKTNALDLLLIHLAEGSPRDLESSTEFLALKGRQLLGPHTAIIHGIALSSDDFRQMHKAGTALIWSPRSNMDLYGITTNVPAAIKEQVTVALAPDWAPTGSTNMLAELGYASRYSREQFASQVTDQQLFRMSTEIPARIAGIYHEVGSILPGLYADLFIFKGDTSQPFTALASARPQDVQLVMVAGVPLYGSDKLMTAFNVKSETVNVCGSAMLLNSAALNAPIAEVKERLVSDLKGYGLTLAPLAECQ